MSDPNLKDFYVRLGRIEKIRRAGGGFEAAGTLGLSYSAPEERRSIPVFRPMLVIFLAIIAIKGIIHHEVGAETYSSRVEALKVGTSIDQIGAFIMQADPVTTFVSGQLREILG